MFIFHFFPLIVLLTLKINYAPLLYCVLCIVIELYFIDVCAWPDFVDCYVVTLSFQADSTV